MDIEEIKRLTADSDAATNATREDASDMLVFGRITQWDDNIGGGCQLEYRGQFDLIKPKRNKILAELWANPVSIEFKPKDGADPDAGDALNGMFRTDMLQGKEAIDTAYMDQVDVGFGAFRWATEYENNKDELNNLQKITAREINEANNRVYFDSNAKRKDKSDARWCLVITTFTEDGWKTYCEENSINYEKNKNPTPFKNPNTTNVWFWRDKSDEVKIGEFYYRKKKRERVILYEDPLGQPKAYLQKEVKKVAEELAMQGYEKVGEKYQDHYEVRKYLVDGSQIIKDQRIAGEWIPVIPFYGDHSFVEGREVWRGIYHDAQDPQRLHNFNMSYMADIVSQGPRQKPIFYPGQIQGFEYMYHENGADDNYPYKLMNEKSPITGAAYPANPVGYIEPPQVPQAQSALLTMTRQAVDDVTGSAMNTDQMLSGQVTEGQITAAQKSVNLETFLYQNNASLSMRHAGRVYASMAVEINDTQREVTVTREDGSEVQTTIMETTFDFDTGEEVVLNDISQGSFEVYAQSGPNYTTQKDQAKLEMSELYKAAAGTQEGQIALMTYLSLQDGPGYKDMRKWASNQLILQGIKEPETDEEKAMVQQAQQAQQQPDPMMVAAAAEQAKADNGAVSNQIDAFKAETDRFEAETKRMEAASKSRNDTAKTASEIKGNELDNVQKLAESLMPRPMTIQ